MAETPDGNSPQQTPGNSRHSYAIAAAFTAIILFPPGPAMGLWGAPLESFGGMLCILLAWLMAWYASGLTIARVHYRITWILVIFLAAYKLLVWSLMPLGGVEARITPLDPDLATPQIVSPFRAVGPNGWPLYGNTAIQPHFINDTRRFDFYATPDRTRHDVPFLVEMQGYARLPADASLKACSSLSDAVLTTSAISNGVRFHLRAIGSTANSGKRLLSAVKPKSKQEWLTPNRLYPLANQKPGSFALAAKPHQDPPVQSILLTLAVFLALISGPRQNLWGTVARVALPLAVFVGAFLVPVRAPDSYLGPAIAVFLFAAAAAGLLLNRHRLRPIHHRGWHCLLLLAWCIVTWRFFMDRYPGGFAILAAGSDSLFHYTFASEILRGDWLHAADAPFSRQFFIRYVIAIVMAVLGEGPVWFMMVNTLAYGVIGLQLASIVRTCGSRRWPLMPLLWLLFAVISPFRMWIPTLFPEVMSILFLLAAVDQLCKWHYCGRSGLGRVAAAAVWLGLSIYTRNNYILSLPLVLALIWWDPAHSFRWPAHWRSAVAFAAIVAAMISAVALRNTLMAPPGEPFALLLSKEVSALSLYQGFNPEFIGDPELIRRYASEPLKMQFLHSLQERPWLYLRYIFDRIMVMFGGPATVEPNLVAHYPRFNLVNLVVFGGALLVTARLLAAKQGPQFAPLLLWSLALPQMALVVVLIGFVGEGYRFLLPCYPVLIALVFQGGKPVRH